MERNEQRRNTEAIILASPEPIPLARLARLVHCKQAIVKALVGELNGAYIEQGRSFEICEVGGGYQIRTLPEFGAMLQNVQVSRPLRLSPAALETLAIVAYRQPVTRAEVEHVRGVDAGAVMRSLLERNLVRIAGHRDVPGRPMLYGTTKRFLEVLGLASLDDLPTLRDLAELAPETAVESAPEEEGWVAEELSGEAVSAESAESDELLEDPEQPDAVDELSDADADTTLVDAKPVGELH
jgi:segregation and condensation protein B